MFCLTAICPNRGFSDVDKDFGKSLKQDSVDETALREFIEENPLPWRQIFDGKRFAGPLAQRYGICSAPRMFLLDREGKVISVKARGDLLDELVAAEIESKTD